jgi:hypothetical protein
MAGAHLEGKARILSCVRPGGGHGEIPQDSVRAHDQNAVVRRETRVEQLEEFRNLRAHGLFAGVPIGSPRPYAYLVPKPQVPALAEIGGDLLVGQPRPIAVVDLGQSGASNKPNVQFIGDNFRVPPHPTELRMIDRLGFHVAGLEFRSQPPRLGFALRRERRVFFCADEDHAVPGREGIAVPRAEYIHQTAINSPSRAMMSSTLDTSWGESTDQWLRLR